MCALLQRQSWLCEEGGLAKPSGLVLAEPSGLVREESHEAGGLAEPLARSLVAPEMPSRGEVPREGKNPREARQAWRSWSLAKFSRSCVGLGRLARGTLVSTVPTVAPGPATGTPKSQMKAKRRGPNGACLGRDTWDAAVAP